MKAQRGAAALPITLVLAIALLLGVMFSHRSVIFEARSAINEVHAAQAHEAAQAGLAWTLAQLNRSGPVGDDCESVADDDTLPWHARARVDVLHASCTARDSGWACHCPAAGAAASVGDTTSPAFSVTLTPEGPHWHVQASGHSGRPGPTAQLQMRLGRLQALDTVPAAALTVRGVAQLGPGLSLQHTDAASGGVTLHTGGAVHAPDLRLTSTPGTPSQTSVVSLDSALAQRSAQGLHASVFRLDRQAWRDQPAVVELDCTLACDTALQAAASQHTLLSMLGGLRINTPLTLGSRERPVLLVVDGPVALHAGVVIHGLVYTRHREWRDTGSATVVGAVIAEGDVDTDGPTRITYDADVLRTLQQRAGTFAPIAGSWRDL